MIRSKMKSGFHQVLAQGVDRLRLELDRDSSGTLFLANHSCWWDLFLVHLLNETIPIDGFGMMEHFNLLRFGFFRRIGAFSVGPDRPRFGPGLARICRRIAPATPSRRLDLSARSDRDKRRSASRVPARNPSPGAPDRPGPGRHRGLPLRILARRAP